MEQPRSDIANEIDVELADTAMISQLMEKRATAKPSRIRAQAARGAAPARRAPLKRCKCGKCRVCLDNARWELVFQQKFADPYYYALHPPRHVSSLNGF
jgi:hypothetical protein